MRLGGVQLTDFAVITVYSLRILKSLLLHVYAVRQEPICNLEYWTCTQIPTVVVCQLFRLGASSSPNITSYWMLRQIKRNTLNMPKMLRRSTVFLSEFLFQCLWLVFVFWYVSHWTTEKLDGSFNPLYCTRTLSPLFTSAVLTSSTWITLLP